MAVLFQRGACGGLFLLAMGFLCATARGDYSVIDLYTMNPPAGLTYPSAAGQVATDTTGQVGGFASNGVVDNAILWNSSGVALNLNPTTLAGINSTGIKSIGGGQQVGSGGATRNAASNHALVWSGTAGSAIDLHPVSFTGITNSAALGTDGSHQVGAWQSNNGLPHALLWSGSAASVIQLQPTQFPGYVESAAVGVSGNQQVGYIGTVPGNGGAMQHAAIWSGTAASAVDLHPTLLPTNFDLGTTALSISGGQEVGYGQFSNGSPFSHALLWTGTAASAVDLNPAGASNSIAVNTNGTWQVGYVTNANATTSASVWNGTAASAVNLEAFLPSNFSTSKASSVNSAGDVFGVAEDTLGNYHSVEWVAPCAHGEQRHCRRRKSDNRRRRPQFGLW